ncbi:MAG: shikimate kinase [Paracoccaceae bacterium]
MVVEPESDHTQAARRVLTKPLVLIGLMGAGKSSVGLRLAKMLNVPMVDSDTEIEAAAALSIPEIFDRYGEAHFRSGERRVIGRLLTEQPRVIATGGGAFMDAETRALIADHAISIWLRAELDVLVARTAGRSHRPLLNKGNPRDVLSDLIDQRHPVYGKASVIVDSLAGQTHEDMAARIIEALEVNGQAFRESQ